MALVLTALILTVFAAGDVEDRVKEFVAAMKSAGTPSAQVDVIKKLSRTRHIKCAQKLAQTALSPYAPEVRVAAANAVGKLGHPKAGRMLASALNAFKSVLASENSSRAGDQKTVEAIVRAIGNCHDRSSVLHLTSIIQKSNIPLMGVAVRALGEIGDPACLDKLIRLHYAATLPNSN